MTDFSKKSEVDEYFDELLPIISQFKVRSICSYYPVSWNNHRKHRLCSTDGELFILFDNDSKVLVIDYPFIDALDVCYRYLSSVECSHFKELIERDPLNSIDDIYDRPDGHIIRTETCSLEYGRIKRIVLKSVTREYDKWLAHGIDTVNPTEETFREIHFFMDNGKSFVICPDDAIADGYTLLWSDDTVESIIEHNDA